MPEKIPQTDLSVGVLIRGVTPFWRASKTTNQPIQPGKPPTAGTPFQPTNQELLDPAGMLFQPTNQPDMLDPAGWLQQLFLQGAIFGDKKLPLQGNVDTSGLLL